MRRTVVALSGAPSTNTSRAGAPMMAAVQAAPRSRSPSICASSTIATSTGLRNGHISTVAARCRLPGTGMRSSPGDERGGDAARRERLPELVREQPERRQRHAALGGRQPVERRMALAGVGRAGDEGDAPVQARARWRSARRSGRAPPPAPRRRWRRAPPDRAGAAAAAARDGGRPASPAAPHRASRRRRRATARPPPGRTGGARPRARAPDTRRATGTSPAVTQSRASRSVQPSSRGSSSAPTRLFSHARRRCTSSRRRARASFAASRAACRLRRSSRSAASAKRAASAASSPCAAAISRASDSVLLDRQGGAGVDEFGHDRRERRAGIVAGAAEPLRHSGVQRREQRRIRRLVVGDGRGRRSRIGGPHPNAAAAARASSAMRAAQERRRTSHSAARTAAASAGIRRSTSRNSFGRSRGATATPGGFDGGLRGRPSGRGGRGSFGRGAEGGAGHIIQVSHAPRRPRAAPVPALARRRRTSTGLGR